MLPPFSLSHPKGHLGMRSSGSVLVGGRAGHDLTWHHKLLGRRPHHRVGPSDEDDGSAQCKPNLQQRGIDDCSALMEAARKRGGKPQILLYGSSRGGKLHHHEGGTSSNDGFNGNGGGEEERGWD